jgi:hypothetical protein
VGRFQTLDEQDVERVFYRANPKQFQADLEHLSKQGLVSRRSVSAGKKGDYGDLGYAGRQEDLAKLYELPIVDGKISLPDLRIEYETAEGERAHIDLDLAT